MYYYVEGTGQVPWSIIVTLTDNSHYMSAMQQELC
jgi:hypothetical protein